MKNLKYLFIIVATVMLSASCSDDDSLDKEASLLGKWNVISIKYTDNGQTEEGVTTCQLEFLQFNFINNEDLAIRGTSGDPLLEIGQCDPEVEDYTYEVANGYLTLTSLIDGGFSDYPMSIESSSSTKLVLRVSDGSDSIEFTLIKE